MRIILDATSITCKQCGITVPRKKKSQKFCSRSCTSKFSSPLKPKRYMTDIKSRIEANTAKAGDGECWIWKAPLRNSYGSIMYMGKRYVASRLAWMLHHKKDAGNLEVCHTCDIPACVNPAHLYLGTHGQNMQDMIDRGGLEKIRAARSPLTLDQARIIKSVYRVGSYTQDRLAKIFNVHPSTIGGITIGKTWREA